MHAGSLLCAPPKAGSAWRRPDLGAPWTNDLLHLHRHLRLVFRQAIRPRA